ncbi:D-alanyl-D-alanine carboxypeptidase [Roseburia sp. MUC/MUC-530-WT-4D]|uniref:D-alanyl-D-alanine carboxypeptidase n=1 Tax=Roseburia porci TaxID=2605790 RepID=A0A6L5YMR0_9FIRM|nr:D-alanyl-D-alanine carboxypeptidase family protein [Roseburia porci]MCI5517925.1 D-alanyl-D-alanine carboxypeptidase [Roseburia sp.]MDD6742523.1 D-alanyl-D-alanine carboxypeptidase [Roseburia porci]MST73680.1 D-alanyl-D-alanine carboxypeptidase [Roseburia porci]
MKFTKKLKRVTAGLLAALCVLQINPQITKADDAYWPEGVEIVSPSAIVMEVNSGTILYDKNSDEVNYPASITKIMTAYLAVQNCSMDETVTFSADAVFKNEGATSHIARDLDEQMTMEQCLYAVLLKSANECAYAVAEHVGQKLGGDYSTFIDLMNSTAKDLGCTNTHFNNPNGLPDENHWTSAHDMALIASAAYKNETFRKIVGTGTYEIPPTNKHAEPTPLSNDHQMLYPSRTRKYLYEYCTGGKTGFTDDAGNTLVTYAEKDGLTLVCVIMHSTNPQHYLDTTSLLDYCFNNFQAVNIAQNESTISDESLKDKGILNNHQSFVSLDDSSYIVIPKTASFTDATSTMNVEESDDDSVATIQYTYAGHDVGSANIIAAQVDTPDTMFDETEASDSDAGRTIVIKPIYVLGIVLAVIAICALIFFIKRIYDNIYVIRHNRTVKKDRKDRFRETKKKKYNKKDRLFK